MANSVNSISYSSTNVTTGAYVTLVASTSIPVNQILLTDTSAALLKLAIGAAGTEVDLFQMPVSGSIVVPVLAVSEIPVGSRLSLKAISANATTGFGVVTLLS